MATKLVSDDEIRTFPNQEIADFADSVSDELETNFASQSFSLSVLIGDMSEFRGTPAKPEGWPQLHEAIKQDDTQRFHDLAFDLAQKTRWVGVRHGPQGEKQIVMPRDGIHHFLDPKDFCVYQALEPSIVLTALHMRLFQDHHRKH